MKKPRKRADGASRTGFSGPYVNDRLRRAFAAVDAAIEDEAPAILAEALACVPSPAARQ